MFEKIVAIEPVSLITSAEERVKGLAKEVTFFRDIPEDADEIVARVADADAMLVNYTSTITSDILDRCPNLDYIGMCCSLYSPESANVDVKYAREQGITVTGIRDYGDEGVVEYVVRELISCFHGFGFDPKGNPIEPWDKKRREITGLKEGIVGLGKSGGMIADALRFFGADISYYSRSKQMEATDKDYDNMPLHDLLANNEVIFTCLNKNVTLFYQEEFDKLGNGKILFNTGLSPSWDARAFEEWIQGDNLFYCDSMEALGDESLLKHPHIRCMEVSAGRTQQAFDRLSQKVLANLLEYNG